MYKRRRTRNSAANADQTASTPATPDRAKPGPVSSGTRNEAKSPPPLSDAFKAAIEKATERAKSELASKGKLKPAVFFMHTDGSMKMAFLTLRGGQQKEALIQRIREKVLAENAFAVITLTEIDHQPNGMILTGVTPGTRVSARVDFGFNNDTKTVTSWKISWLSHPIQNPFLAGVFTRAA